MIEISGAITGLGAAWKTAKTVLEARDDAKVREAVQDMSARLSEVQFAVLAIQEKALQLSERINTLTVENEKLRAQIKQSSNYIPVNIAKSSGEVFWALLENGDTGSHNDGTQPMRYFCQTCFQQGKKLLLSFSNTRVKCYGCGMSRTIDYEAVSRNMAALAAQAGRRDYDPYDSV